MITTAFVETALAECMSRRRGGDRAFTMVFTDSRKLASGALFVAITGEKFDGHGFIEDVLKKGAAGVVCLESWAGLEAALKAYPEAAFFPVKDTLTAYRELGAAWRLRFDIPVIAIAGSVGKTTTKEMLAAILRGRFSQVLKTQGSQNGFVGIPMTLLEIRPEHEAAVIEVGIDEPGTMTGHMDIVSPTAGLLSAIGPEHLEKLIDVPTVAREEGKALEWLAQNGAIACVRTDDEWIAPFAKKLSGGKLFTYSIKGAERSLAKILGEVVGSQLRVSGAWPAVEIFDCPLPGSHNAGNLLSAVVMAHALGCTPDQIRAGLLTFETAKGRTEIKRLFNGALFVCDHYNANPSSMVAALKLLSDESSKLKGARVACLGDMLELGPDEEKFHRGLKDAILGAGVKKLYLYGPRMRWLADEMKSVSGIFTKHFDTHEALAKDLASGLVADDSVLLKGSRGMRMETVLEFLK